VTDSLTFGWFGFGRRAMMSGVLVAAPWLPARNLVRVKAINGMGQYINDVGPAILGPTTPRTCWPSPAHALDPGVITLVHLRHG